MEANSLSGHPHSLHTLGNPCPGDTGGFILSSYHMPDPRVVAMGSVGPGFLGSGHHEDEDDDEDDDDEEDDERCDHRGTYPQNSDLTDTRLPSQHCSNDHCNDADEEDEEEEEDEDEDEEDMFSEMTATDHFGKQHQDQMVAQQHRLPTPGLGDPFIPISKSQSMDPDGKQGGLLSLQQTEDLMPPSHHQVPFVELGADMVPHTPGFLDQSSVWASAGGQPTAPDDVDNSLQPTWHVSVRVPETSGQVPCSTSQGVEGLLSGACTPESDLVPEDMCCKKDHQPQCHQPPHQETKDDWHFVQDTDLTHQDTQHHLLHWSADGSIVSPSAFQTDPRDQQAMAPHNHHHHHHHQLLNKTLMVQPNDGVSWSRQGPSFMDHQGQLVQGQEHVLPHHQDHVLQQQMVDPAHWDSVVDQDNSAMLQRWQDSTMGNVFPSENEIPSMRLAYHPMHTQLNQLNAGLTVSSGNTFTELTPNNSAWHMSTPIAPSPPVTPQVHPKLPCSSGGYYHRAPCGQGLATYTNPGLNPDDQSLSSAGLQYHHPSPQATHKFIPIDRRGRGKARRSNLGVAGDLPKAIPSLDQIRQQSHPYPMKDHSKNLMQDVVYPSSSTNVHNLKPSHIVSWYIDYLIHENEHLTQISRAFTLPINLFHSDDFYFMDSLKKDVHFPSLKFLSWMQEHLPSINVNAVNFQEGRRSSGPLPRPPSPDTWTGGRQDWSAWQNKSRRDIIHDVFFYFQHLKVSCEN